MKIQKQEAQLMLTNPRDAFIGQSRSPGCILSSCAIVTLTLRRAVFPILDVKNVMTLKLGSLKVIESGTIR